MKKSTNHKFQIVMLISGICLAALMVYAIGAGQFPVSFSEALSVLMGKDSPTPNVNIVIRNVRLPRVILSTAAGAGLAVSGAAFQSLFSNPLATPDTLGAANGASFGACLAILLGLNSIGVQLSALAFGLLSLVLIFFITRTRFQFQSNLIMIVLAGMVISTMFSALVSFTKYIADPNDVLPVITFWLMGSFSTTTMKTLRIGIPFILIGTAILFLLRYRINYLTLREEEAKSLGINLPLLRGVVMVCGTMITAAIVSLCGVIGWVGLLIPHIARMVFGNQNAKVIPASILFGAIFMLLTDTIARTMMPFEIPVSILTALIGAPVFIVLLRKTGGLQL